MKKLLLILSFLICSIFAGISAPVIGAGGGAGIRATNAPLDDTTPMYLRGFTNAQGALTYYWSTVVASTTNAQPPSAVLSNLVTTVANNVTNVEAVHFRVVNGTIFFTNSVLTNLARTHAITNVNSSFGVLTSDILFAPDTLIATNAKYNGWVFYGGLVTNGSAVYFNDQSIHGDTATYNGTALYNGNVFLNDEYIRPISKTITGTINVNTSNYWSFTTPGTNFTLTLTAGVVNHGTLISLMVSNSSPTVDAIMTNTAGIYRSSVESNVTLFVVPSNSVCFYHMRFSTNFGNGTGSWFMENEAGPEYTLSFGSGLSATTNNLLITLTAPSLGIDIKANSLMVTNNITNALAFYGVAVNGNTLLVTNGVTNLGNFFGQTVNQKDGIVTNNIGYLSTDIFPDGQATNFRADYTFAVRTISMTNAVRFTNVMNAPAAGVIKPYTVLLRNTNGSTYRLSVDASFRRSGTNDVAVANNQNARVVFFQDGTGGAAQTNHTAEITVYDSP